MDNNLASNTNISAQDFLNDTKSIDKQMNPNLDTSKSETDVEEKLPFPTHCLPKPIIEMILGMETAFKLPTDMMGVTALVAMSTAIGNSVKLQYKIGYEVPAIIWGCVIGKSSVGKTPIFIHLLKPFKELDADERKEYKKQKLEYNENLETYKVAKHKADKKGDKPKDKDGIILEKPNEPPEKNIVLNDATIEASNKAMEQNPKGCLMFSDEILNFTTFDKYSKGGEESAYLSYWSGIGKNVHRAKSENLYIPNPFYNVIGGIQPSLLNKFATKDREASGFVPRFLFAYPLNLKKPKETGLDLDANVVEAYNKFIKNLYAIPCEVIDEKLSYEKFYIIDQARQKYVDFKNELTDEINDIEDDTIRAYIGKLEQYCLRFALILEVCNCIEKGLDIKTHNHISLESMEKAIELTLHYKQVGEKVIERINYFNPLDDLPEDKRELYNNLPNTSFELKKAIELGKPKLSESTIKRFLKTKSLFKKLTHGKYEKSHKN